MGHYAVAFTLWVDSAPPVRLTVTVEADSKDSAIELARKKIAKARPDADAAYDGCVYLTNKKRTGLDKEALSS